MKISRKKSSLLNISFTIGYQLVLAIYGLVIPNLILNLYGVELHGYTSTVNSIMSYIALLNAGIAPVAVQALYEPIAKNNKRKISEIIRAVNQFYIKTGCLYTLAVVLCGIILPFIIKAQIPSIEITALMIVIGATSTLDCFIYSKYRVLLQADQRLYILSILDIIASILRILVQLILILTKQHIVVVMSVPAILVVIRSIILAQYCKKTYSYIDKKVTPDKTAFAKRWSALIHQIAGLIVYNTDVMILTIFTNLTQVSIYSAYNMVFAQISNVLNSFSQGLLASFGQLLSEKRHADVNRTYNIYEFGYFNLLAFIYGVAACMILPFIKIYTHNRSDVPYVDVKLAVLFILVGVIQNLRIPFLTIVNAAGDFKETQNQAILESIINLSISLILLKPLGMYGLLIGTLCSNIYRTVDIGRYIHKHILNQGSVGKTIFRSIRTMMCILFSVIIYEYIFGNFMINSWLLWIVYACMMSGMTILLVIVINLITEPKMVRNLSDKISRKIEKKQSVL